MKLSHQLKESFYYSIQCLTLLRRNSIFWLLIYLSSGLIIFSLMSWFMISHQDNIKAAFLNYLFPQSWHAITLKLADWLFESQAKTVLSNMILSGSLVISSILLFPIKEKFSLEFEKDAQYNNGPIKEFPLHYQAWEEIKLFLIYLTAQAVILWLGYYPYKITNGLSIGLSYLFLFFTFGLDFISPTLQRHRTKYSLILKILLRKPLLVISFGFLFSIPSLLISQYVFTIEDLTLIEISVILFITNLFFLTLAVPAGTRIASAIFPVVAKTLEPKRKNVIFAYSGMSLVLIVGLFLHGKLIASMHHKSQLLKAEYDIDWSSIEYDLPSFSQFFKGKALSNLSFDLVVNNPTEFDIIIEKSQIFIEQKEKTLATIDVNGFEILSGKSKKIKMQLDSNSDMSQLSDFNQLLEDWRVDMHFELLPGIPFILNIVEP